MDDGYIQTKQRELNEKLVEVEQKITVIDKKMDNINKAIDNYDVLISALKKQDDFHVLLREENKKNLDVFIEELKTVVMNMTETIAIKRLRLVEESVKEMAGNVVHIDKNYEELTDDFSSYLATFSVLMGILCRDGVIPRNESDDIMNKVARIKEIAKGWDKNKKKISKLLEKMERDSK